jgi:hypothetical protein
MRIEPSLVASACGVFCGARSASAAVLASSRVAALVTGVALLALSACSPSALSGNVFRHGNVAFEVGPIPDDWRKLDETGSDSELASFAFRDDKARVTVGGTGRCGRDGDDVPLRALTQHLTLGFTERTGEAEQKLSLDGREALRTELQAKLDGVTKFLVFVVIKKDECVYDFWRVADSPDRDARDFDRFVGGFRALND